MHLDGPCIAGGEAQIVRDFSGYTRSDDSCCNPTTCKCGAEVFFIRHNGGSVWINPPLGPPWDEHECEFVTRPDRTPRSSIAAQSYLRDRSAKGYSIGVVKDAHVAARGKFTIITLEDGSKGGSIVVLKNRAGFLTGRLVFYNPQRKMVTCADDEKYSFGVLAHFTSKNVECPLCGLEMDQEKIAEHLQSEHWYDG
jgi:hypothetical protein